MAPRGWNAASRSHQRQGQSCCLMRQNSTTVPFSQGAPALEFPFLGNLCSCGSKRRWPCAGAESLSLKWPVLLQGALNSKK